MKPLTSELRCITCNGSIESVNSAYVCTCCNASYYDRNGIVCFGKHQFYWNQISKEKMSELYTIALKRGWKKALVDVLLPATDLRTLAYALNESRGDWHLMLSMKRTSRVLDLSGGWGASTIPLARHYSRVVACDATYENLDFLKLRAEQERIENLQLVHIDPLEYGKLPFPNHSFDLVVMNGLLEWIGTARNDLSPMQCQKKALSEAKRVLKPNGTLYVGIENRLAYYYFLGKKGHSDVPFADLLPRKLANLWCKLMGKKKATEHTYIRTGNTRSC